MENHEFRVVVRSRRSADAMRMLIDLGLAPLFLDGAGESCTVEVVPPAGPIFDLHDGLGRRRTIPLGPPAEGLATGGVIAPGSVPHVGEVPAQPTFDDHDGLGKRQTIRIRHYGECGPWKPA